MQKTSVPTLPPSGRHTPVPPSTTQRSSRARAHLGTNDTSRFPLALCRSPAPSAAAASARVPSVSARRAALLSPLANMSPAASSRATSMRRFRCCAGSASPLESDSDAESPLELPAAGPRLSDGAMWKCSSISASVAVFLREPAVLLRLPLAPAGSSVHYGQATLDNHPPKAETTRQAMRTGIWVELLEHFALTVDSKVGVIKHRGKAFVFEQRRGSLAVAGNPTLLRLFASDRCCLQPHVLLAVDLGQLANLRQRQAVRPSVLFDLRFGVDVYRAAPRREPHVSGSSQLEQVLWSAQPAQRNRCACKQAREDAAHLADPWQMQHEGSQG